MRAKLSAPFILQSLTNPIGAFSFVAGIIQPNASARRESSSEIGARRINLTLVP